MTDLTTYQRYQRLMHGLAERASSLLQELGELAGREEAAADPSADRPWRIGAIARELESEEVDAERAAELLAERAELVAQMAAEAAERTRRAAQLEAELGTIEETRERLRTMPCEEDIIRELDSAPSF